eukprot:6202455-Pleurochrysis_carterae.AAC.2
MTRTPTSIVVHHAACALHAMGCMGHHGGPSYTQLATAFKFEPPLSGTSYTICSLVWGITQHLTKIAVNIFINGLCIINKDKERQMGMCGARAMGCLGRSRHVSSRRLIRNT